ncbi:hypothetical protein [Reichenbachiella sp. 5M10]|uniref:hypothetical protein n=1 Tax=Reichenbachiella sp. 5M10 TaxID=1889772 RepID=UPI00117A1114|nr:hypothetical protein [Reichenbachiella sp. 5M10]
MASCSEDEATKSNLASIESFEIAFGLDEGVEYEFDANSISVSVPFGTVLSGLETTVAISENALVEPVSGSAIDYTDGEAVTFTVTAEDATVQTYDVTVTVRGEVGSGSKLETYSIADLFGENATTTYLYSDLSGFVTKYTKVADDWGTEITSTYELIYDDKNQVTELKFTSGQTEGTTTYGYNEDGQIISGEQTENGEAVYSYTYTYSSGILSEILRTDRLDDDFESTTVFTVENGNVINMVKSGEEYTASYDDKENPFKNLYPAAFAAINIGIEDINVNNPISGTLADNAITYEYNEDGYPVSASYTYFDGLATVDKAFTYYAE